VHHSLFVPTNWRSTLLLLAVQFLNLLPRLIPLLATGVGVEIGLEELP
jgi:hypothetical protein